MSERAHRGGWIAGAVLFVFGASVFAASWSYEIGSLRRMGPGYFPMLLGAVLCGFALLILWQDLKNATTKTPNVSAQACEPVREHGIWRPAFMPLVAILLFAVLLETAGLVPAVFACVTVAGLAEPNNSLPAVLAIAAAATVLVSAVFVYALGIPLRLFVV